jgi:peptidyl-prolyl cis-trans isomerase D
MAVIGKIRQRSWMLFGFIAVALLIFIIQAAWENPGGGRGNNTTIGKINGDNISATDYQKDLNSYEDGLKLINPTLQLNDQIRAQIQDEVWNTMAANEILGSAYNAFGLKVSEGEMGELMWGEQPHPLAQRFLMKLREVKPDIINQQTGQLDQAKIKAYISSIDAIDKESKTNLRQMLGYVEKLIEDEQVKQKYASLVAQSFYMPTFMAKEVVNSGRSAKVAFVSVPYTSLADDKYKVTDDEITAYLKANSAKYEQEASRVVDIVSFDVVPSSTDTAQTLAKINKMRDDYIASLPKDSAFIARNAQQGNNVDYYTKQDMAQTNRNVDTIFSLPVGTLTNVYKEGQYYMFTKIIDRTVAPDTVRAAHILLSIGKGTDDEKAAANKLADSLIRVIATNQKNFGEVASENSQDQGSKAKGGDLGYFSRGQMVKEFNDKVFYSGMQPGQIAKVESPYGLHIILLIDAKSPIVATKFADFAVELAPSGETETIAYENASAFQQKNPTAADFDKAAKTQNVQKNIVLSQNMVEVPQVGPARKLVQWAFQQEKVGAIDFFDNDSRYTVAKLSKIAPKGLPKAEDVREEISAIIRNEKKGKDLVAELNKAATGTTDLATIATKVKDATVTDTAVVRYASGFVQGLNNEPKLVGTTFGTPVGKTSKAVAGERVAFIVQPKSIEDKSPEMLNGDINMYKQQMQGMYTSRLNFQSIFESILKKAKVDDQRYKFY